MAYIMYVTDENKIVYIDEERYVRFDKTRENDLILEVDNMHDLGYCPARFFWSDSISLSEPDIKISPITSELDSFDWYLYYSTAKKHLDLYASYPIYSGYERDCHYESHDGKERCDDGF